MPAHIDDLKLYKNVNSKTKSNILIGNGLSIGVSDRFAYSSLRRVALDEHFFASEDNAIFDLLDTSDFENVLRRLREALELNQLYELPPEPLRRKHRMIRSALAKSIRHVHPKYQDVEFDWLQAVAVELATYKTVFTTSYDLLLYWIMGSREFRGFTDFFWSSNLTFDLLNVDNWHGATEIYYLHGALFLQSDDGTVKKVQRTIVNQLLDHVPGMSIFSNLLPLFISEGTSLEKRRSIAQSEYLSFCLNKFSTIRTGLTVFGHSLNKDADKHIIDAINDNRALDNVAISIFVSGEFDQSNDQIIRVMNSYLRKLKPLLDRNGEIEFFAHNSSPFAYGLTDSHEYELPLPF